MNWKLFFGGILWFLLLFTACRKDEISFDESTKKLGISSDTVILDTVYNHLRSETYVVKLFNQENKNIRIPKIYLGGGSNSQYKINVDGKPGHLFTNIPIRAKDSLFIFVEISPQINTKELLAEDHIYIQTHAHQQQITLLSLIQDAEFFVSRPHNPKIINTDTHWDNSKVKIILGKLQVAEGKTLSISKGTKIYFMEKSGLKILKNARLNISGNLGEEVIFRGYKNTPRYDTLPQNWDKISVDENAFINLNYTKIFGGTTGIKLFNATANIQNTIIYTFQDYGIDAIQSLVDAKNLVISNTGIANFNIERGGKYSLIHSTLINYWKHSHHSALAMNVRNETAPLYLDLKNSIVYTKKNNAIKLNLNNKQTQYSISSSLVKYSDDAGFVWENNPNISQSIKNENPMFINTSISKMDLRLKDNSPAKGKANRNTALQVPLDIKKINRTSMPNMGAYQ